MVERSGIRSSIGSSYCILEQDTFTSQKVLVIPRKRWLRPEMVVVVLGFYVSPTAKVIRRRDLGLKSHPKDSVPT